MRAPLLQQRCSVITSELENETVSQTVADRVSVQKPKFSFQSNVTRDAVSASSSTASTVDTSADVASAATSDAQRVADVHDQTITIDESAGALDKSMSIDPYDRILLVQTQTSVCWKD
jgi:hypothetical protein